MGGLREERFGGSGRGVVGEWRIRARDEEMESGDGDGSETGPMMKKNGKTIVDLYRCQLHPGLQG